ncbi:A kinase (PRKA) anchor protein 17A [Nesidiocoris tenuis]|uniref:A kinase (PRKA) anchor protein 17A n=1 Tax=Nesidiocoris tenuis TaxID=355587 RepID=A0ABN7A7W4_9HEMI|nr:A kinase (PRKA) anchor protein 17A [Nesidiocoris tenuis]
MANPRGYPTCTDLSDIKPLCKKKGMYLKPLVRLNISVQLPKTKSQEYSISNHALMEAVRQMALPDEFCSIKTTRTSVDMVRFEAEVEMPKNIRYILSRLDGEPIKLKGYLEQGRVRASIAKNDFPSRHDWDSFFRDAKHMNELKAGERPDTIHVQDLPVDWFVTKSSDGKPCERLVCRIFEQFGAISAVDIPSNDPYRSKMGPHISGIKQFNFSSTNLFETYVQYKDYVSFVCAMDALRGMKLLKKDQDEAFTQVLKVDFDKTKHLSETSIRKRKLLREKLMEAERQQEEKCEEVVDNIVHTKRPSVEPRRKVREKSETPPSADESRKSESPGPSIKKIIREEKLYLVAQRKLESIRLLSELLERIADKKTVGGAARMEKRPKPKPLASVVNPTYSASTPDEIKDEPFDNYAGNSYANQQDGGSYNRGFWRGRGQRFQGQRGRGRFQRGRGFFNNQGPGRWENQQNPREGFSSRRDGYPREDYSSNPLQREPSGSRDNRDGFRRHMDGPRPYFNPRDQMFYNNELQSMYYRYFQGLVHSDSRRSRSRSGSRMGPRRMRFYTTFDDFFKTAGMALFIGLFFFGPIWSLIVCALIYNSPAYPILIAYFFWMYIDRETPYKNGRRCEKLCSWWIYSAFRRYFPHVLVKTADLPAEKNYLLCLFPHGIFVTAGFAHFTTNRTDFNRLFPGLTTTFHTLNSNFVYPFARDWSLGIGLMAVSKETLIHGLTRHPPRGRALVICPGGSAEAMLCGSGTHRVVLKNRKGFIKIAIITGTSLVPVYAFGETDLYDLQALVKNSWRWRIVDYLKKLTGVAFIIPPMNSAGFFQKSFGFLPRPRQVTTIVGKPMEVEKNPQPSNDEIDAVHIKFVKELTSLFEEHKHKYVRDPDNTYLSVESSS